VSWLYAGYFCGWYMFLGLGLVAWFMDDPRKLQSWEMVAFGIFAYFLVIPSLLFQLIPIFAKWSPGVDSAVKEGFARGAFSRGYAFVVGLVGSVVALVTCALGWGVASLESEPISVEQLDENGVAVTVVSMLMGVLAVIAACPWLGQLLLLGKCRLSESGARQTWSWRIVPVALALAWAGTAGWLGYRLANAATVLTARLDFAALPDSDEPFQERLRSQPGVAAASVSRHDKIVVVEFAVCAYRSHSFGWWTGTVMFDYTTPRGEKYSLDLTQVAAEAGYKGLKGATFDRPKTRW
jgi:hypothetical protein